MADDTAPRKPVSRRVRFEILRRDSYTCRYCGAQAPDAKLTVDHVVPVALGGSDDPTNLVTACHDCNAGKGSTSPDEHIVADVDAAALLLGKAMERVADQRRKDLEALRAQIDAFDRLWDHWHIGDNHDYKIPRPRDWRASIERFIAAGLSVDDFAYFITVAMESHVPPDGTWRYFCGCCWRELSDRQEKARRMIEDGAI